MKAKLDNSAILLALAQSMRIILNLGSVLMEVAYEECYLQLN